jgi:DNA-binding CsgD family transcriptional regulator
MKIQELNPMTTEEYVAHFLPLPAESKSNTDLITFFGPTIDAIKKLAFAPYFWFISDYTTMSISAVDSNVENHVASASHEWLSKGPEVTLRIIHPEDLKMMIAYNRFQELYLGSLPPDRRKHLKFNTYFRVLHKLGSYRWYMSQMPDYHYDATGKIMYSLRVAYDISHIKKEGLSMMTMLDDFDPGNQIFLCQSDNQDKDLVDKLLLLSAREMEIVKLLSAGHLTKQIASLLSISPFTVENHKRSIFKKTHTRSTNELVAFAFKSGIVG